MANILEKSLLTYSTADS